MNLYKLLVNGSTVPRDYVNNISFTLLNFLWYNAGRIIYYILEILK